LTWETRRDDISHSLIRVGVPFTVECTDITEDGRFFKEPVLDALRDDFLAVFIVLYIPYGCPPKQLRSKESATRSGEEG
jgi:hypothetical protein